MRILDRFTEPAFLLLRAAAGLMFACRGAGPHSPDAKLRGDRGAA